MKNKYLLLTLLVILGFSAYSQHQFYFENFQASTNTFTLNDTGFGPNKGNNKWIVNNNYTGGGIYPNTINEDSTYSGTISYAPFGKYLHIYDSSSGYLNDNYNPSDSSTRFAHMTTGICTKSMTDINFNFFYLCQGSASAFGEVYYSIDNGPWILTPGRLHYDSTYKWRYQTITSPAFSDVEDLRFGFLWHNNSASGRDTSALGIDDVSIFGAYDSVNHPITCQFSTVLFDSCLGGDEYVYIEADMSDSTCESVWDIYMSNGNGMFPGSYAWYNDIIPPYDIQTYWYLVPPITFNTVGHCYKFKLERTSYPYLTFLDSVCFPFDSCPGTITTLQPPATLDTNPVCAGSTIDVPFFSTGIYNTYNVYFCQLIDSIGSTAVIDTIGNLPSNVAYPYPPGDVVSTIPLTVPAGCKYYLRVVSTTGNRAPSIWGPFCIQHCDIYTNGDTAIQACLSSCRKQPHGYNQSIDYDIHKFDSLAHYKNGNKFSVQLISFMNYPASFSVINTGLLGLTVDTVNSKFILHVPCPDTLFMYGINPGIYYVRIVADSSSFTDSSLGSLIHLTIGEPADSMYLTVSPGSGPYCAGSTISFYTNPDDQYAPYNSTYTWWITDKRNGTQPFIGVNTGYLGLNSAADTFLITCQENNYGCFGAKATIPDTIIVLGDPSIVKTGPNTLCVGDTGTFYIPFANNTNYSWKIYSKAHSDTSNNVLKIRFDTSGTVRISVVAFNACFTDSAVWSVRVYFPPVPVVTGTTTFCAGNSTTIKASGGTIYTWSTGSRKDSIIISPATDTTVWVKVANPGCYRYDTVHITVLPVPSIGVTFCIGDTINMQASGAMSYAWNPSSGLLVDTGMGAYVRTILNAAQTFTVTGTAADGCKDSTTVTVDPSVIHDSISSTVTIIKGQSTQLTASGGGTYFWQPSEGLSCDSCESPIANPTVTTTYTCIIRDSGGCSERLMVTVDVNFVCGIFVADAFTPNNPLGANTKLYLRSECLVSDIEFIVFDRWGNKVFEMRDDLSDGWDGTYKGQPMNAGTYVYYATGKTDTGKVLTKKGNVALIR